MCILLILLTYGSGDPILKEEIVNLEEHESLGENPSVYKRHVADY